MKLATLRDGVALVTLVNVIGLTPYNQNITDNIYIIFNKHYSIAKNKVTCLFVLFFLEKNWGYDRVIAGLQDRRVAIHVRLRNRFGTRWHCFKVNQSGKLFVPFCLFRFTLGHSRRGPRQTTISQSFNVSFTASLTSWRTWFGICGYKNVIRSRLKIKNVISEECGIAGEKVWKLHPQNIIPFLGRPLAFC